MYLKSSAVRFVDLAGTARQSGSRDRKLFECVARCRKAREGGRQIGRVASPRVDDERTHYVHSESMRANTAASSPGP